MSAEDRVREIRRKTRKKYSSEEKVRIVLEVLEIILEIKIGGSRKSVSKEIGTVIS